MNSPENPLLKKGANLINRRWFIEQCGFGLGSLALTHLLGTQSSAKSNNTPENPLEAKYPHFAPKAKNVIFLFMAGAPSHLELFDNKPQLAKFNDTLPPPELLDGYRSAFIDPNSKLLGPKFKFSKYGQSGIELSEMLPHLSKVVDNIAVVKSMSTDAFNHAPAQLLMNTGSQRFGRPGIGAWITYGLGSESEDLPAFVVFSSGKKGPSCGSSCWGSGFLPTVHQGVQFRGSGEPVLYLSNPEGVDEQAQRDSLDTIQKLNQRRLDVTGDPEIATRINSFEMAFRMQSSALPRNLKACSIFTVPNPVSRPLLTIACWHEGLWSVELESYRYSMSHGTSTPILPRALKRIVKIRIKLRLRSFKI